jgi:hypothetical protein
MHGAAQSGAARARLHGWYKLKRKKKKGQMVLVAAYDVLSVSLMPPGRI